MAAGNRFLVLHKNHIVWMVDLFLSRLHLDVNVNIKKEIICVIYLHGYALPLIHISETVRGARCDDCHTLYLRYIPIVLGVGILCR